MICLHSRPKYKLSVEDTRYENNNIAKGKRCMTQGGVLFQNKGPTTRSVPTVGLGDKARVSLLEGFYFEIGSVSCVCLNRKTKLLRLFV